LSAGLLCWGAGAIPLSSLQRRQSAYAAESLGLRQEYFSPEETEDLGGVLIG